MLKVSVLTLAALAASTVLVSAFEAKPFTPPPRCTEILGSDHAAGLKSRVFEMLEAVNWFEGERDYLRGNLFKILLMLPLDEREIRQVIAKEPEFNIAGFWQIKLAEATGDWSILYDPKTVNYRTDYIRIGAFKEALADARAGRPIDALQRFRDRKAEAIAAADNDTTRELLEDPNMEAFIAVGILRRLIIEGELDNQAKAFAAESGVPNLDVWLTAMIRGREGEKDEFSRMMSQPDAGTISPPSLVGTSTSPFAEFIFQAIAAKRAGLRDGLRSVTDSYEMRQAREFLSLVIERQDIDAMAFAYSVTEPQDRTMHSVGAILVDLSERPDPDALRSLDADTKLPTAGFPVEADKYNLRGALVYSLLRAGRSAEALDVAGDLTIDELGTEWTYVQGKPVAEQMGQNPGEGVLPAIVLFADESDWPAWRKKLTPPQNFAFDFLVETQNGGSNAAEKLLNENPDKPLFGSDPWRHIGYFQLTSAFFSSTPERFESWYQYILEDPARYDNFMDEWFWLVREQCLGWTYEPSGRTEAGVVDYTREGSVFAGGVGGMILLTSKP